METIEIKTKSLTPEFTFDGLSLEPQFANIEKFYGIPATLHNVDKKFKTHTYRDVLEAAAPTLQVLVEGNHVQVLDPKSVFMPDTEFDELISMAEHVSGTTAKQSTSRFQRQATIKLADRDTDNFLSDAFARNWTVTRRAEGGISLSTGVVRLACTNGMVIPDKQFSAFIRNGKVDNATILGFHDNANGFSVDEYLRGLFTHNGEQVPCSVADLAEMHACLQSLTGDDLADVIFPIKAVQDFYAAQDIDTTKLARKYLDKLPTGLTYYQALNILTNGAKAMVDPTIDNQVRVAKFCQPKRMQNMKATELHWNGTPTFSRAQVHAWMGDGSVSDVKTVSVA